MSSQLPLQSHGNQECQWSSCLPSHLRGKYNHTGTFGFSSYSFYLVFPSLWVWENRRSCFLMCPLGNFLSCSPSGSHPSLQRCEKRRLLMTFQTISFASALHIIRQLQIRLQQRLRLFGKLWLLAAVHHICCALEHYRHKATRGNW